MPKTTPEYSLRQMRDLASLSIEAMRAINATLVPSTQPRGAVLYAQGDEPSDVYILFSGTVKLTAVIAKRKIALLRIAQAGEFLGLDAVMAGLPHLATARVLEASSVASIGKQELLSLMDRYPQLAITVARRAARECTEALSEMLFLRVTTSAAQRLAILILRWSSAARRDGTPILYTQSEIGQMIGASRETVTRLMKRLERMDDIRISDSKLKIVNRRELERIARVYYQPTKS